MQKINIKKLVTLSIIVLFGFSVFAGLFNVAKADVFAGPTTAITSTSNLPLGSGQEGRTFFANGRYWIFYFDGTNYGWVSSTDGVNWGSETTITTSGSLATRDYSFYVSGTTVYYAITLSGAKTVYYRNGTLNSVGTITWQAEGSFSATNNNVGSSYVVITTDSLGNMWIAFTDASSYLEVWYYSSSTWTSSLYTNSYAGAPYQLVPLTNGKMALLNTFATVNVEMRCTQGVGYGWSGNDGTAGNFALSSATAIGDTVQVAVTVGNTGVTYYTYPYGGTWTGGTNIDTSATEQSAVIASDNATDLFITYLNSTSTLFYKSSINSGTSWSAATVISTSESVPNPQFEDMAISQFIVSDNVSMAWGNNTSPYQIRFADVQVSVPVTITSSFTGSGFITVNGTAETTPYTFTALVGTPETLVANSPANTVAGHSQYVFSSWSDSGAQSHVYTVPSGGGTVTATFQLQYYLTVTGGNSPSGQGWVNSGSSTTASSNWVWGTVTNQSRSALTNWQLDTVPQNPTVHNTGNLTTSSITMNSYHTVNFVSTTQYFLNVLGGHNVTYSLTSETGDYWYNSADVVNVTSNWVWNTFSGLNQTALTNYALDGVIINPTRQTSGNLTSANVTMSTYHMVAFSNTTQYHITSSADSGSYINPSSGWIDNATNVLFTFGANNGYTLATLYVNGVRIQPIVTSYTFTDVTSPQTISVTSQPVSSGTGGGGIIIAPTPVPSTSSATPTPSIPTLTPTPSPLIRWLKQNPLLDILIGVCVVAVLAAVAVFSKRH